MSRIVQEIQEKSGLVGISPIIILLLSQPAMGQGSETEEEAWKSYWACVAIHEEAVAGVIQSLAEGAELILESLCSDTATNLANTMVNVREGVLPDANALVKAYETYRYVVARDTRERLYYVKLRAR
ncbi:hypothetical protein [Histidinibacterium lentulum]|uniref:hypothetical protein n=1 Tax=Histidinibacterium lentulum TaxID=2480588 RepID=UPI000F4B6E10|nr:hypothetical protein [Histidinibacterium lentulum]